MALTLLPLTPMARLFKALILLIFLSLLSACQERKADDRDPVQEGYQKIDRGNYDEAIDYLTRLAQTDARPDVRIALASAYAARAGVKIDKFWDFAQMLKGPPITEEQIQKQRVYLQSQEQLQSYAASINSTLKKDIESLSKVMALLDIHKAKLEALPYVSEKARSDLEEAVKVLKGVETRGGRLYSGALNLVLLRSDVRDGLIAWSDIEKQFAKLNTKNPKDPKNNEILCSMNLNILQEWLVYQFDRIKDIAYDVQVAYPSKAKDTIVAQVTLVTMKAEISKLSRTLTPRCP